MAFLDLGLWVFLDFQPDNGGPSEKPMPTAENSKEFCAPEPAADLPECDALIAGEDTGEAVSSGKGDAEAAAPVAPPIADGTF